MEYAERLIDRVLDRMLEGLPAVAIQGPKGVGKTATAKRRATTVINLANRFEREVFAAKRDPLAGLRGLTLIDEWQREPASWDAVREAVDDGAPAGSFLIAGSSAPDGADVRSGAGRITPLRMRPLSLAERGITTPTVSLSALLAGEASTIGGRTPLDLGDYIDEILASGFPGIRWADADYRRDQLDAHVDNTVQREFAEQGVRVRRPDTLRAWLSSYAAATGTTATYSSILDAATPGQPDKPARTTTMVYRDVLARAFLLDPLMPWVSTRNPLSRLGTTPKHYLADPGLAARLLQVTRTQLLAGGPAGTAVRPGSLPGALFEHLVVQSVMTYAQSVRATVGHVRQYDGRHEIDLVVELDARVVGIEITLSASVDDSDTRHLHWLESQLGDAVADLVVVTTGAEAYRRRDGIAVVPAALLGP